ncbi:MAG: site-specific DNA-methyltransferase [Paludibacteraceae bacterium]|nr:site-specific DNA-methyltransferase [Paludibacteraceae bacterium]
MNKQFLPDSYTAFKNKVGLTNEQGEFMSESREVVLSWPYKDCMLEGGQTKEDAKRQEIFWNETLAPEEINRLTEPKALCNFRRYDSKGEHEATVLRPDDNLIIKGNNLLALYSLRQRFRGRIKLIYIDPPYNTGSDSFGYNDSFNMSTWLTFMKNRLEIAKELLTNDGAIYLQLDFNCVHYAKVLMDSVFGKDNFQREIIWRIGWVSGYKTADNNWIRNHDTILFYSRNKDAMEFIKHYIPRSEFKSIAQGNSDRYPIEDVWNGNEYDDLNSIAIVSFAGETVSKLLNEEDEVKGQKSEKLIKRIIDAHVKEGDIVLDFFGGTGTTGAVAHKMGVQYILCEQLDKHIDIIKRRLQKVIGGDRSGISKAVGWNPQNPGLLDGDKYAHNSFVYCELAQANQQLVDEIMEATLSSQLQKMWTILQEKGFLSYKVTPKMINEHAEEFADLSLDDQKRFLIECLDKNMLYIPFADMDDSAFTLSDNDKLLTRQFYARR